MSKCDVLKISDNEVEFMCGTTDYDKGAAMIQEKYNIPLILITLGKDGSRAYYKNMRVEAAPFLQENTIETTGAGDTFCASTLNYVLDHGLNDLTEENLKELLTFAKLLHLSLPHERVHFALCQPAKKSKLLLKAANNFSKLF